MKKRITQCLAMFAFACLTAMTLPAQTGQLEGIILSKKGKIIEIQATSFSGEDFVMGTVADMSKYFEEKLGNMTMNGWLNVAKVKFIPTSRQNIEIEILEEKSDITVNDQKVDHFKVGKRMKLEWPAAPSETPPKTGE